MGDIRSQHQIEIPIERLSSSLVAEKVEKNEKKGECRYCHEEEYVSRLEAPCSCNGSLKYAHRRCVSNWCNVKRSIICEICKEVFVPNYSVVGPPPNDDDDIFTSERRTISGTLLHGINRLSRSMNSDFTLRRPTGGVIFGTLLLVFVATMVIRDAYYYTPPKEDKFSRIMYIGVVTISLPIYILNWVLMCRDQRERRMQRQ